MFFITQTAKKILMAPAIFLGGLLGPVVTWLLYASGENWDIDFKFTFLIVVWAGISVIIASVVNFCVKHFVKSIICSCISCFVFYCIFVTLMVLIESDSAGLMWLPVAFLFIPIYTSPMAVSISTCIILLLRIFSKKYDLNKEFIDGQKGASATHQGNGVS
jgi:hypothetical protein